MKITEEQFNKTLKDTRFVILDENQNTLVESEFEDGSDFYLEDYEDDINKLANECMKEFSEQFDIEDDESLEIFSCIENSDNETKLHFIEIVKKYPSLYLASWVGNVEHCDMIFDVWYDINHELFFTYELDDIDTSYGIIDDIDKYELQLNS